MLKVLVVDDSLVSRKKITKTLESLGHEVVFGAVNGQEAIDAYAKYKPDLVTMDITMPDMDGITAAQHIIRSDGNAKIIMVTSHSREDMIVKSIQAGAVGHILKPITDESVAHAISEVFVQEGDDLYLGDDKL